MSRAFPRRYDMRGGNNGKRTLAVAGGRTDPGDYPVVAVLRPLIVRFP
jgi:hypothetical protein